MKILFPVTVALVAAVQAGCSSAASTSHRSQPANDHQSALLAASAGLDDKNVKAAEAEQTQKDEPETQQEIVSVKAAMPGQSPHQSPHQSPVQSPHQSPHQSINEIPGVTIKSISYGGSACPQGSVASNIAPDAKAFTLLFDSFYVESAPQDKSGAVVAQTDCQVSLTLGAPAGWQVALLSVDYRGFADLADGDSAVITSSIQFAGSDATSVFASRIDGALSDNFQARSEVLLKTVQWSECGGGDKTLHMSLSATLRATTDMVASLSLDSVDGELSYKSGMIWRRCRA